jgi:peptidoglycan/xylan/chitin deacetylase (PgdA/CDA1 family)
MALFKKIYFKTVSAAPINLLKRFSNVDVLLPYHHVVSDERLRHICHLYTYKSVQQFQADLDYLLLHFTPLHPLDLVKAVRNGEDIPKNSFLLTFDDGFREINDIIAPLLYAKGVPALFFLNPAYLDNKELCYRNKLSLLIDELENHQETGVVIKSILNFLELASDKRRDMVSGILQINYKTRAKADKLAEILGISFDDYLRKVKPYLLKEQVRDMSRKGFCFGGHSVDHPNYRILTLDEQIEQTIDSCKAVQELCGLDYSAFSFPHDDLPVHQVFFDRISALNGYKIDVFFGTQNQKSELQNRMFHRFNAERPDVPIEKMVKGILLYNIKKREVRRV